MLTPNRWADTGLWTEWENETMNETPKRDTLHKKPYSKPEIRLVPLRPEEAVLGACKSTGIIGPIMGCTIIIGGCSTVGS
jgi:hypothetical protein